MKQKDLADEYAEKEYKRVNGDSAPIFTDETCFTFDDIKAAFNAGRESVVENMPELKWVKVFEDGPYIAISSFGVSYRIEFVYNEFNLFCNSGFINCYLAFPEVKQAANEHFKQTLKQVLKI